MSFIIQRSNKLYFTHFGRKTSNFFSFQNNEEVSDEEGEEEKEEEEEKENGNSSLDSNNLVKTKKQQKSLVNGDTTLKNEYFERKAMNMFKVYDLAREASEDENWSELYRKRSVAKWSYFASREDIDGLLEALNPRGFRERLLKDAVQQEYKQLTLSVDKCPLKADLQGQKKEFKPKGRRGGRNQPTVDKSRYKTMEEFIEANLRDQILDLEDRIWQGGLGVIKNTDREAWRAKVENGIYDDINKTQTKHASDECKVNGVSDVKENGDAQFMELGESVREISELNEDNKGETLSVKEEKPMVYDDEELPVVNGVKDEIKQEHSTGNLIFFSIVVF